MVASAVADCFLIVHDCDDNEGQTNSKISFIYSLTAVEVPIVCSAEVERGMKLIYLVQFPAMFHSKSLIKYHYLMVIIASKSN